MAISAAFARVLPDDLRAACDALPDAVYGIAQDDALAYTNPAWDAFAAANAGDHIGRAWPLGRDVFACVPDALVDFYRAGFGHARRTGGPWRHAYECSSPERHRRFHMEVMPLGGGALLVVNALRVEEPAAIAEASGSYRDAQGFVSQCAHCRRVRCVAGPARGAWHFVPSFVAQPDPHTSHGLCEPCFAYHFGARAA